MRDESDGLRAEFPSTWWSLIDCALVDGTTVRHDALNSLVRRYTPPLRAI